MWASPMPSCQSDHRLPPVTLVGFTVLERLPIAVALHGRGNDCTAQPSLAQTSAWAVRLCRRDLDNVRVCRSRLPRRSPRRDAATAAQQHPLACWAQTRATEVQATVAGAPQNLYNSGRRARARVLDVLRHAAWSDPQWRLDSTTRPQSTIERRLATPEGSQRTPPRTDNSCVRQVPHRLNRPTNVRERFANRERILKAGGARGTGVFWQAQAVLARGLLDEVLYRFG